MTSFEPGSMFHPLSLIESWGIRCNALLDCGAAEGGFFVQLRGAGLLDGAKPYLFDANTVHEPSLKRLAEATGGAHRIVALSDRDGTVDIARGPHPYWDSIRPPDDIYWQKISIRPDRFDSVPARRLDDLMAEIGAPKPYLLKMDIQGAEVPALKGAARVLADTAIVIIEADLDDFQAINRVLIDSGFELFDITELRRGGEDSLGWFYPIYLRRDLYRRERRAFWHPSQTEETVRLQRQRHEAVTRAIDAFIAGLKR